MLKKTITFKDFNDNEVSEDHHFHLSQAELVELEMSHKGGLSDALQKIIDAEDGKAIMAEFKNIILSSYGKRSEDGRRFVKNQQLREEFESSEAYSALFMELILETDKAIEFVNGIVPGDLTEKVGKLTSADLSVVPKDEETATDLRIVRRNEIEEMSADDLRDLYSQLASGKAKLADEDPNIPAA